MIITIIFNIFYPSLIISSINVNDSYILQSQWLHLRIDQLAFIEFTTEDSIGFIELSSSSIYLSKLITIISY